MKDQKELEYKKCVKWAKSHGVLCVEDANSKEVFCEAIHAIQETNLDFNKLSKEMENARITAK